MCHVTPSATYVTNPRRPSQPISLRLDTCMTDPLRQRHSPSDMSAILSPLSPSDRIGSGIFTVSPTDSVVSAKSIFSNSGCSSATTVSSWDDSSNSLGWGKDDCNSKAFADSLGRFPSNASEKLLRDGPSSPNMPQILPATLPDTVQRHPSNSSVSSATHSANRCTITEKRQTVSTQWSNPKDLVKSLSEVLEEHIEHSRQALRKIPSNSKHDRVNLLSPPVPYDQSDLRCWSGFSRVEIRLHWFIYFAFTNVAYSMTVAADRVASKVQTEQWFQHCLSWSTLLSSERDKRRYEQIACAIWKPQSATNSQSGLSLLNSIERENKLVAACKHFLDRKSKLPFRSKTVPDKFQSSSKY